MSTTTPLQPLASEKGKRSLDKSNCTVGLKCAPSWKCKFARTECKCRCVLLMLIQQHGGNFHISLTVQGRPAALSPPLSFGLVYTTVPGVLHCCLLSSGFCMFQPQPTREHMAHCVMMLLAAQRSAFTSGVHCTQDTRPSCPTDLRDTSAHLSLPLPFPSSHLGPIKQHYLQRAGTSHPSCCEVQHTPCCAARQHWPHWFYWGTTLPSVSLPNTWYSQSLLKQTKTFYHIL